MSITVAGWLRRLGLKQYTLAFTANDIDGDILPELTADDLIGLGVTSIGHRRKLLAAIAALRDGAPPRPSAFTGGSPFSNPLPLAGPHPNPPRLRGRVRVGAPGLLLW